MNYALTVDPVSGVGTGSHAYGGELPSPLPPNEVACTQAQALTPQAWQLSAGVLVAATLPLAVQASAALAAGLAITSTSTPALNATYACDLVTQGHISAEMISIVAVGTFADGTSTVAWPDVTGALHTFTIAQWRTWALAIAAYVAALAKCMNGASSTLPAASATIA